MRLKHLPIMHQSAQFGGSWRKIFRIDADKLINCFSCGKVMTHRTNSTKSLYQHRRLPIWMALDESFKSPKFSDMKKTFFHLAVFIEMNRHSAVTFYAGDGIYGYLSAHSCFIYSNIK